MKHCHQCHIGFEVSEQDQRFYDRVSPVIGGKKYSVSEPTLCPDCRRQRRFSWRNERSLYHRKCDLSGKQIISAYSPEKPLKVYAHEEWWSDHWSPFDYGRTFDFSRPFFDQFAELQKDVPQVAVNVWYSENSNYCNYVGNVKDSYLLFGSVYSDSCYYGSPYYSKNCVDTLVVRECEGCYECVDCRKLYECFYCQDCQGSSGLIYCYDLQDCRDCIGCAGLRNKQYYIFNKPYAREDYEKAKAKLNLCDPANREHMAIELQKIKLQIPHRYMRSRAVENVTGNYVYECKNVLDAYYADRSEDCRYVAQVVDLKNCYDNNYTEENELCVEYLGAYQNHRTNFSKFCNRVSDAFYCDSCFTSRNLFGCIGLRNAEYCILNKKYSKADYEKLVPRIIGHMQKTQEWGEFFPAHLSPFAYNESVANEYFPLDRAIVASRGWKWQEDSQKKSYKGPVFHVPRDIRDVPDTIVKEILICEATGRPYKIIPQEFAFYRTQGLPIPVLCPDERHRRRLLMRNPRQLWDRLCAGCEKTIRTTYAPDRPEKVYCDECYLKLVY